MNSNGGEGSEDLEAIRKRVQEKADLVRARYEEQKLSESNPKQSSIWFYLIIFLLLVFLGFNFFSPSNEIPCPKSFPNCADYKPEPNLDRLPDNDGILPGQR